VLRLEPGAGSIEVSVASFVQDNELTIQDQVIGWHSLQAGHDFGHVSLDQAATSSAHLADGFGFPEQDSAAV